MASQGISLVLCWVFLPLIFLGFYLETCYGARVLPHEPKSSTEFIRTCCRATRYPALCFSSLSAYTSTIQTSPMQLAHTALSVSMDCASLTSTFMKRISGSSMSMSPREAAAVSDCVETLGDSVDELRESLGAMGHLGGRDMGYQLNSIQTWVSAALTDDYTCLDGFPRGDVKNVVRGHVVNVAQLTSNALALISSLTASKSSSP